MGQDANPVGELEVDREHAQEASQVGNGRSRRLTDETHGPLWAQRAAGGSSIAWPQMYIALWPGCGFIRICLTRFRVCLVSLLVLPRTIDQCQPVVSNSQDFIADQF